MASRNASKLDEFESAEPACRIPTSAGFDCCARVASGQAVKTVTAVPQCVMNSRRLIASPEAQDEASYRVPCKTGRLKGGSHRSYCSD